VVRLYGLRNWIESGYKQVKGKLNWADLQIPLDRGDPPTWALVCARFVVLAGIAPEQPAQPATSNSQAAPAARR